LDEDGKTAFILQRQWKGYRNNDPSTKQQKPIPLALIHKMISRPVRDPGLIAFHQLLILAFFFAMRSCEYLKLPPGEERRTKAICLGNLTFRKNHRTLAHDDPNLMFADTVTITFEFQKNDQRDDSITQSRTGDPILCPVRAAAAVVQRMRASGLTKPDTPLYSYTDDNGKLRHMETRIALGMLRTFIKTAVRDPLGLKASEIGLHSMRSASAMAMYLNKVPIYTIMLLGRWSSDAFLRYIRKEVSEFSSDVSRRMIKNRVFHHVTPAPREDPRTHNPLAATANSGMGSSRGTPTGVFSVWQ
jgi:hypothetical protein